MDSDSIKTDLFPEVSGEDQFRVRYVGYLSRHTPALIEEITTFLRRRDVRPDGTDMEVQVFPDEDGVGAVSLWLYLNGRVRLIRRNDPTLYCGACVRFAKYA